MYCEECGYDMKDETIIVYNGDCWICPNCGAHNFEEDY